MILSKLARVIFIRIEDNAAKLQKLCTIVHDHFIRKDKVLITAPSNEAAVFLDKLLWKVPEESFTPHLHAQTATKEQVIITTASSNLNQAAVIFNLLPTLYPNTETAEVIYELLDLTSKEKEEVSSRKQAAYRDAGYSVVEI